MVMDVRVVNIELGFILFHFNFPLIKICLNKTKQNKNCYKICFRCSKDFRRVIYIRYANNFVVLLALTKEYTESLKEKILAFLQKNCGKEKIVEGSKISDIIIYGI